MLNCTVCEEYPNFIASIKYKCKLELCAHHRIGSDPILLWMLFLTAPALHLCWVPPTFGGGITKSCWRQNLGVIQWLKWAENYCERQALDCTLQNGAAALPDKLWSPHALTLRALMQLQLQRRAAVDCWGVSRRNTTSPSSRTNC